MRVLGGEAAIANPFVGYEQRHLVGNDLAHEAFEGRGIDAIDDAGDDLALAADRADDRLLTGAEAATTGAEPDTAENPSNWDSNDQVHDQNHKAMHQAH